MTEAHDDHDGLTVLGSQEAVESLRLFTKHLAEPRKLKCSSTWTPGEHLERKEGWTTTQLFLDATFLEDASENFGAMGLVGLVRHTNGKPSDKCLVSPIDRSLKGTIESTLACHLDSTAVQELRDIGIPPGVEVELTFTPVPDETSSSSTEPVTTISHGLGDEHTNPQL